MPDVNPDCTLTIGYDYRFGALRLQFKAPEREAVDFLLPVREILARCPIPAHELRALCKEANNPPLPERDIEEIRQLAIERTNVYNKVVLDVGGYDGWAAKLCLDRGARRAICLDSHQYEHYGWAERKLPGVEYVQADFLRYEVCPNEPGLLITSEQDCLDGYIGLPRPDVIIFYNVLYHLKNPWAGLAHLYRLLAPGGTLLLCTLFRYHDGAWVYLYEPRECNPNDESVFWGPSILALERLLRFSGWEFEQAGLALDRVVYRCWPGPAPAARFAEH